MKQALISALLIILLAGCSSAPDSSVEPTFTASPMPPTATITASPLPPTETQVPSPTPFPGKLVLPLETLGKSIPWLPLDEAARPGVHYIGFNTLRPPFNSATV